MTVTNINFTQKSPQKPYNYESGLNGIDQKAAACALSIGKAICGLADELRKNGDGTVSVPDRIAELIALPKEHVAFFGGVYHNYCSPSRNGRPDFEWYYAFKIDFRVLSAFIPILRMHVQNVRKGLPSNLWLTKKSIEIELPTNDGGMAWFDLKELDLKLVQALAAKLESDRRKNASASDKSEQRESNIEIASEVPVGSFVNPDSTPSQNGLESGLMSQSLEFLGVGSAEEMLKSIGF